MHKGEGEMLHAARRRRFWILLGGLAFIGFLGGLLHGAILDGGVEGDVSGGVNLALSVGVLLIAILAAVGSWRFFANVDEVEVADNLWGSLIGFYAYALLLPVWWALSKLGRAPEPDQWIIYFTSMVVAFAAYLLRKWQAR